MERMFHNIRDGTNCLIGQFFFFNFSLDSYFHPPFGKRKVKIKKKKLPHSTHVPDVPSYSMPKCQLDEISSISLEFLTSLSTSEGENRSASK